MSDDYALPNTGIRIGWLPGQSGWGEQGFNPNFRALDILSQLRIRERNGLNTPPVSPAAGVAYLVGTNPTGDWAGFNEWLAFYDYDAPVPAWFFVQPRYGWSGLDALTGEPLWFDGDVFTPILTGATKDIFLTARFDGTPVANQVIARMLIPGAATGGLARTYKIQERSSLQAITVNTPATDLVVRTRAIGASFVTRGSMAIFGVSANPVTLTDPNQTYGGGTIIEVLMGSDPGDVADLVVSFVVQEV